MPRIFDNIEQNLLPALQETLNVSDHSDFCVGYFNLRGWKQLDSYIEKYAGGSGKCCRLLVGMQKLPQEEIRVAFAIAKKEGKKATIPLEVLAEQAFKAAVDKVLLEHKQTGDPIAVWQGGKVVHIPADQIEVREAKAEYSTSPRKKK
jgi:hypothetical protein